MGYNGVDTVGVAVVRLNRVVERQGVGTGASDVTGASPVAANPESQARIPVHINLRNEGSIYFDDHANTVGVLVLGRG